MGDNVMITPLGDEIKKNEFISSVKEKIEKSVRLRKPYEKQWFLNMAFYLGKHYVAWHPKTNSIVEIPRKRPTQVRLTVNFILNYIRTQVATILSSKPTPVATPADTSRRSIESARISEKFLQYFYDKRLKRELRKAVFWSVITGNGFLFAYFDKNAGKTLLDIDGIPIVEGEVVVKAVSPLDVFIDPTADDIEEAYWVVVARTMGVDEIEMKYGVKVSASEYAVNQVDATMRRIIGEKPPEEKVATVYLYFEKPNPVNPRGLYAAICDNKLLEFTERYPYAHGELPVSHIIDQYVPGRFYGMSSVENAIPLQKEYNRARSQMIEIRNLFAHPIITAPEGSIEGVIDNQIGRVVEYKPIAGAPNFLTPPAITNAQVQDISVIKTEMDTVFGLFDISAHGSVPPNVRAASAMSMLKEQDELRASLTVRSLEEALSRTARQILELVRQFYSNERMFHIAGADKQPEVISFKGADLVSPAEVRIEMFSAMPQSKSMKIQTIYDMWELGIVRDPKVVLKLLEFGNIEEFRDEVMVDEEEAKEENSMFRMGQVDPVTPQELFKEYQNHWVHYSEHNKFRKTPEFKRLPDSIRGLFDIHVDLHGRAIESQRQAEILQASQSGAQTGEVVENAEEGFAT